LQSRKGWRKKFGENRKRKFGGDGDQREFDLEIRVTTNGNLIIPEMFHSYVLNK